MKKVLLLCFDNPFLPPKEGGKLGMNTRIESLALLNIELDVVLLNKPQEGYVEDIRQFIGSARNIQQYKMNSISVMDIFSKYPICANKRYVKECVDFLKNKHYDVAIYEGEHVMKYRLKKVVSADKHILYMHDIESVYRKETAKAIKNPIKKFLQRVESAKFKRLEKYIDSIFDSVMFVSKDERNVCAAQSFHAQDYIYVPMPSVYHVEEAELGERTHRILYVGDLSIYHNFLSVKWFCEKVFPIIKRSIVDATFRIVGRSSTLDKELLEKIHTGIEVKGYVDDLDGEYRETALFVCPTLYGAGVKVKTIDALAKGQLVLGTTKAIEGTMLCPNDHLLIEDDPLKFAALCIDVLSNRIKYQHIAKCGFDFIKGVHSIENQSRIINELI